MMIQSQFPGKEIQRPCIFRAGREHGALPDHLWTWSRKFPAALLRLSSSWCWNNPRGEELFPAWCLAALSDRLDSEDPGTLQRAAHVDPLISNAADASWQLSPRLLRVRRVGATKKYMWLQRNKPHVPEYKEDMQKKQIGLRMGC